MVLNLNYNCYSLRKITKKSSEIISTKDNLSLMGLLDILISKYGKDFANHLIDSELKELKLLVLINGMSSGNLNTNLNNLDNINFLYLTAGG